MSLKPVRCLLHLMTACLVIAGVVVAVECVLLNREQTSRGQLQSSYENDAAVLVSSSLHHTLRPNAIIEPQANLGTAHQIRLNSLGLRGPEPIIPKPTDVFRIVVLGDETIFAPNVADSQTATNQLQVQLQKLTSQRVEVVNAGVPGYCPLLSLLQFRHQLLGLHPDMLVLNYDLTDAREDQQYRGTLNVDANGVPLSCTHPVLLDGSACPTSGTLSSCAIGRWAIRQLCDTAEPVDKHAKRLWPLSTDPHQLTAARRSLEPVLELARMAKQVSTRFILTATPTSFVRLNDHLEPAQVARTWAKPRSMLLEFSAKNQIEFCDVSETMVSENSQELYSTDGLTVVGQQILAGQLAAHITSPKRSPTTQIQQTSHGG